MRAFMALLALLVVGCASVSAPGREEEAVRAAYERGVGALVAKNWDQYSKFWAHEPHILILHPAAGEWLRGWSVLEPKYRSLIESDLKISTATRRFEVRVAPSGDVAWAAIEIDITINGNPVKAWQFAVFEKIHGEWRLVAGIDAPAKGSAAK